MQRCLLALLATGALIACREKAAPQEAPPPPPTAPPLVAADPAPTPEVERASAPPSIEESPEQWVRGHARFVPVAPTSSVSIRRDELPRFAAIVRLRGNADERFLATWTSTVPIEEALTGAVNLNAPFVFVANGQGQAIEVEGRKLFVTVFELVDGLDPNYAIFVVWRVEGDRLMFETILDHVFEATLGRMSSWSVKPDAPHVALDGVIEGGDAGYSYSTEWTARWTRPRALAVLTSSTTETDNDIDAELHEAPE